MLYEQQNIVIFAFQFSQLSLIYLTMDYKFIKTEYIESVSGGDPEIISELVSLFKEQAVEISEEMKALLEAKSYKLLGLLAHKAKSSVSIMGMDDLAVMLKTFELQARDEKESQLYESYIIRFSTETLGAINELEDLVNRQLKSS